MIKSRRVIWAGMYHVMEKEEVCTGVLEVNMKERNYSEGLGVDGMIILKWIFEKEEGRVN